MMTRNSKPKPVLLLDRRSLCKYPEGVVESPEWKKLICRREAKQIGKNNLISEHFCTWNKLDFQERLIVKIPWTITHSRIYTPTRDKLQENKIFSADCTKFRVSTPLALS